ncbi:Lrp/AsnC family transcriptional regulator [Algivirga pacifica]|uniref:Lrp/AsnC family transcriptional regulator n=1 Tax=Algivirga pacifica TaxID=1162670 RepID=A0ABP9CZ91_9BACT
MEQGTSISLDSLDFSILAHLQEDGRKSFTDIAEEMGVSVGTVRNRYNKLVQENVLHIIGWTDPVKAGFNAYARVTVDVKPISKLDAVAEALLNIDEISFLAYTSGDHDLEINLQCKDNKHLMTLMHESINTIDGVHDTHTTVYFQVLKWASHDVGRVFTEKAETKEVEVQHS